ncbi:hypothetical protein H206_06302 [Candidatus Electrothrix aarhusensis]|uniref:Uncharacterized protein n=1 Tax=Candidatus Electrothrix aarhusensis TaxID=1859131 RepID=A0A444J352_9BACT|nr:hypothetical protein H206_06302 [Candidatus Electrothrix aarhusensis]
MSRKPDKAEAVVAGSKKLCCPGSPGRDNKPCRNPSLNQSPLRAVASSIFSPFKNEHMSKQRVKKIQKTLQGRNLMPSSLLSRIIDVI